jgi:hypothetical protein
MTGQQYLTGIAVGGLLGGATNGITALVNGKTFWSGNVKPPPMTPATIRPELPSLNSSKPEVNTDGLRSRPLEMTPERPVFSETLEPGPITVKLSGELREVEIVTKGGMTKVGRWMSEAEYNVMKNTGRMLEGAGGKTSVAVGGPNAFTGAAKGSVYVEFEVPTSSLIQGGQSNWHSIIGPNANNAQLYMLQKQGGQLLPQIQNLSPILKIK